MDFEGADLVTQIVWKCPHVAKLDFRVPAELGRRHGHDWTGLAIAVIYLNRKIDDKEVIPERIETPLNYLLGVLKDIRSPVFPPGELEELGRKVEYLQKSEAQLLLERLESDYGVTVSPNLNWGYESVDPGQSWLPIDFIRELPSDVRNKVKENARQMIRIVGRKKAENEHKTLETSDRRRAL